METDGDKKYKELLTEWLDATRKREAFLGQFVTKSINATVTRQATKVFQHQDWEQAKKLDEDEEIKKERYYDFLKDMFKTDKP